MLKNIIQDINNLNSDSRLNEDELSFLYNQGVKAFQVRNYSKALPIFLLLIKYQPTNDLYAKALAGTMQASKDYISAALMYKYAYSLSQETSHDMLFYAGVCFYEAKQYEAALTDFLAYQKFENEAVANQELGKMVKMYCAVLEERLNQFRDG